MTPVDKLLNAPVMVTFDLGNGRKIDFGFRELTTLQLSEYRAKLLHVARNEWLTRIKDIAGTISNDKERRKYFVEAAQHEPDWEPELVRLSITVNGIKWGLQAGSVPELTDEVFDMLNSTDGNQPAVERGMSAIMGIKPVPEGEEQKGAKPTDPQLPVPAES